MKQREEQKTTHVMYPNRENYNKPFTKEELTRAIQATKNSAPGPCKINNEMLKHLPPVGLDSLLVMYSKIWQQGYFPEDWLESKIIPITKPGKDLTNHSNYRRIALTSTLCENNGENGKCKTLGLL